MDYSRRELADRLAAHYVLGTLRGPARRRFDALLPAHPALRQAVHAWQERLAPLSTSVPEIPPSDRVWQRIEAQLFAPPQAAPAAAPQRWWQGLTLWRSLSALSSAGALGLLVLALQVPPPQAPVVIVLGANPDTAQAMQASFVASVSGDGRVLVLRPIGDVPLGSGRALELWAVPAQGAPRSLGLVQAAGATTLLRAELLRNTAALAVSVEPTGGSPTGAPTGPIVALGKLQT